MSTQTVPILLSLLAAILGAMAQYLYKVGAAELNLLTIYKNFHLIGGIISFTWVLILFLIAFKMGGKMFVIYPVYATTYIWSGLIAHFVLKEPINHWQWLGTGLIIIGVSFIGFGHAGDQA
jgi:drug/metabolite transporter (DMT)-like permease